MTRLASRSNSLACSHLADYVAVWAAADALRIRTALHRDFVLDDPLLGSFTLDRMQDYFAVVADRFAVSGPVGLQHVIFRLHGPMRSAVWPGQLLYAREAPHLGVSGSSSLELWGDLVFRDHVSYDLNMATEVLRGRSSTSSQCRHSHIDGVPQSGATHGGHDDQV